LCDKFSHVTDLHFPTHINKHLSTQLLLTAAVSEIVLKTKLQKDTAQDIRKEYNYSSNLSSAQTRPCRQYKHVKQNETKNCGNCDALQLEVTLHHASCSLLDL